MQQFFFQFFPQNPALTPPPYPPPIPYPYSRCHMSSLQSCSASTQSQPLPLAPGSATGCIGDPGGARDVCPLSVQFLSFPCSFRQKPCQISGGSKRGARDARPPGSKFFQFHAVLGKLRQNRTLAPPWGVGAPSSGKSWIRHCK